MKGMKSCPKCKGGECKGGKNCMMEDKEEKNEVKLRIQSKKKSNQKKKQN